MTDKVQEFATEMGDPATLHEERVLALKCVLHHFVGDVHQPLHASDNQDRGGNCVQLAPSTRAPNLHAYWNTTGVQALGSDPATVAAGLRATITPGQLSALAQGDATTWSTESFEMAKAVAYTVGSSPGCGGGAPVSLPPDYGRRAQAAATLQLERAAFGWPWC